MKRLTRIKLVNWHYFSNQTIEIKGSTMLTGENGSGKSTILDAVQFVLVGDSRKVRFNISAHDETRRDLKGYLRCKTGSEGGDGSGFLRSGDFTTYVALEFYDTRRKEFFLVGTLIDSYESGEHDPPRFFKWENQRLSDELFFQGGRTRNVRGFRAIIAGRKGVEFYTTAEMYRTQLLAKLGHLNERFFSLLIKALAFKPITHIRNFVYDYVLDEQSINIDAMRDNLQHYRHFEALLNQTKEKLDRLDEIAVKHKEKADILESIRIQDYIILRAEFEGATERLQKLEDTRQRLSQQQQQIEAQSLSKTEQYGEKQKELEELFLLKANNSLQQYVKSLEDARSQQQKTVEHLTATWRRIQDWACQEAGDLSRILATLKEDDDAVGARGYNPALIRVTLPLLQQAGELSKPVDEQPQKPHHVPGNAAPRELLNNLADSLQDLHARINERRYALRQQKTSLTEEKNKLEKDLAALRNNRMEYDDSVNHLRRLISEEATVNGRPVRPQVLCELLEIPNEKWQDAVEGYLNTQRFDLIVHPEAFDQALTVYERRKKQFRIANVGLVNTARIRHQARPPLPGSLAEEVTTDNPFARAYIERLLGNVMKCESEQELKRHPVAITPTCMTYRNHTARQIHFSVYETPYIGRRAIRRQREMKEKRLAEVNSALALLSGQEAACDRLLHLLPDRRERFSRMLEAWDEVLRLPAELDKLAEIDRDLQSIDRSELDLLERKIAEVQAIQRKLMDEMKKLEKKLGEIEEQLREVLRQTSEAQSWLEVKRMELERFSLIHPATTEKGSIRYPKERRDKSNSEIIQNFSANRQSQQSRVGNIENHLFKLRVDYNSRFQFGAAPDAEDNSAYEEEHRKLAESEFPEYEEKIAKAKVAAEEEFKEHFVYKLREHIDNARMQFDKLNTVLKDITFGQDRYQFQVAPAKDYRDFYDMIMDETLMEGFTLFSSAFQEKHKSTIERLFSRILDVPEEEQARNIDELTDYRTYLEYDIRILHGNGDTTYFSKVCREKSGGETQTPYYVAIVASFLQLYQPKYKEDTIRLMLFDEAFNRMDGDRIENTLTFIRQLDLQLLAAAPTDKADIVTPHVTTTLLVIRDGRHVWLQDYHQFMSAQTESSEEPGAISDPDSGLAEVETVEAVS